MVVSALGGITDLLTASGELAAAGDESYKEKLRQIEHRHLETVQSLAAAHPAKQRPESM